MSTEVVKLQENVIAKITTLSKDGGLILPSDYSAENAIRGAWLILQENEKAKACTDASIANALFEMSIKGLSVVKNQGYFIPYGNRLTFQESYMGTIMRAKRDANVKEVQANIIYAKDVFEFGYDIETGHRKITKHETAWENISQANIKGAYAIITFNDGTRFVEIMTFDQIQKSWNQGVSKGNSPAHKNFPEEMCKKTVIGRALKIANGSSDDASFFADQTKTEIAKEEIHQEIEETANTELLEMIQDAEVVEESLNVPF
jgi:recombination protein RecT